MINIGSFILIAFFLWSIIRGRSQKKIYINLFCITIIVELMIERGYFVQIASQQIAYRTVCELVLFIISVIMLFHKRNSIKVTYINRFLLVFFALSIGWLSLALIPSDATGATMDVTWEQILVEGVSRQRITFSNGMLIEIMQVIMFLVIALCAYAVFDRYDWMNILKRINRMSAVFLYSFVIEIVTKYVFKSAVFHTISDFLLGTSDSTYSRLYARGSGYMLTGFTKEGSHLMFSLAIVFLLMYTEFKYTSVRKISKKRKVLFAIIGIIMLLSMSFTSLYMIGCLVLFVIGIKFERKGGSQVKFWILVLVSLAAFITAFYFLPTIAEKLSIKSFWGRRLFSLLEEFRNISNGTWLTASTAMEWSNRVRIGSTYETMKLFFYRPLFGLGFASASAHSSFAMLFSGMGIIGTMLYIRFLRCSEKIDSNKYNIQVYVTCIIIYLLMNLFNSLSLRPFYETWVLLLFVSFRFIAEKQPGREIIMNSIIASKREAII